MDAGELAAVLAPLTALAGGIYREVRLTRRSFAREVPVVRGYLENIAKATGAPSPTFPPPPPPRSPDDLETPMRPLPRILPVLLALAFLPLSACVASREGGGFTVAPPASVAEVDIVKAHAVEEASTLRRELEAAEARVRADMDAADAKIRADVLGQVETSNAAWSRAVAEGKSFGEAAAAAATATADKARADAERAATLATEANSRSADAFRRAGESAEERRKALEEVLEEARANKWTVDDWLRFAGIGGATTAAGMYELNRRRNKTRAAVLAVASSKPASGAPPPT